MKEYTAKIVSFLSPYFAKAPQLPANWKGGIVSIMPWLALIFGVLGVIGAIAALGIVSVFSPLLMMGGALSTPGTSIVFVVLALVSSALLLVAFPGVKGRKMQGWDFLFWSELVSIVSSVISLSVFGVIFGVVGLYILFQIRSHYK